VALGVLGNVESRGTNSNCLVISRKKVGNTSTQFISRPHLIQP